jgi:hypothetical protein
MSSRQDEGNEAAAGCMPARLGSFPMRNRHCAAAAPPLVSSPYMRRLSNESGQADVLRGAILRNLVGAAGTPPRAGECARAC